MQQERKKKLLHILITKCATSNNSSKPCHVTEDIVYVWFIVEKSQADTWPQRSYNTPLGKGVCSTKR